MPNAMCGKLKSNRPIVNKSKLNDGLVADLQEAIRLLDSDTLKRACSCYFNNTNGSTAAYFAQDKVRLKIEKIIKKISN